MASHGLKDQDRLDGASNYVIWKTKILTVLEQYDLEAYVKSIVVVLVDNNQRKKYKAEQGKEKRHILDGVPDHVVSHLQGKDTTRDMWEALCSLYEGSSKQQKMYLEQNLQRNLMEKGDGVKHNNLTQTLATGPPFRQGFRTPTPAESVPPFTHEIHHMCLCMGGRGTEFP